MNTIKNNKGMTLTELLTATLIMLLVSLGLTTGVALANKQFISSIRQSEAQELYSTISSIVTNELKFTKTVYSSDGSKVIGFFSNTYPISDSNIKPYIVVLDKEGSETDDFGQIAFGQNNVYNRILGSSSYANNLGAKLNISYSNGLFTVTLDIGTIGGNSIKKETFNVFALNTVTVERVS